MHAHQKQENHIYLFAQRRIISAHNNHVKKVNIIMIAIINVNIALASVVAQHVQYTYNR